jgi:hypothetical protein
VCLGTSRSQSALEPHPRAIHYIVYMLVQHCRRRATRHEGEWRALRPRVSSWSARRDRHLSVMADYRIPRTLSRVEWSGARHVLLVMRRSGMEGHALVRVITFSKAEGEVWMRFSIRPWHVDVGPKYVRLGLRICFKHRGLRGDSIPL